MRVLHTDVHRSAADSRELSHEELPPLLVRRWPERRTVILVTALLLFLVVFLLRLADSSRTDAVSLLYVVPVALVALELGLRAGIAAGAGALALVAFWTLTQDTGIGALGYVTRASVLVGVGALGGTFSDRMRRAQARQALLLRSGLDLTRLRQGDDRSPVGPAIAARVMEIAGDIGGVRVSLPGEAPVTAGHTVGRRLVVPVPARVEDAGHIELFYDGSVPDLEARAAIAMLALQGAVATDNRLLLDRERERLALEAELRAVRERVEEQRRSLALVLDSQERQRRAVAIELHEEAAQALAGVLLGLRALRRSAAAANGNGNGNGHGAGAEPELERLRGLVHETVIELRRIATGLRPSALDQLGLRPALERLAGDHEQAGVRLDVAGLHGRHEPEIETTVYRLVEESLGSLPGPVKIVVDDAHDGEVRVGVTIPEGDTGFGNGAVETMRARVELLGGHVDLREHGLDAVVPARLAS